MRAFLVPVLSAQLTFVLGLFSCSLSFGPNLEENLAHGRNLEVLVRNVNEAGNSLLFG